MPRYLRPRDAARYLGFAPSTLAGWRTYGTPGGVDLPFARIGGAVVYDRRDLDRFARAHRLIVKPPTEPKAA